MSFQRVLVIGNLGKDPVVRFTVKGGKAVCNFSVAVTESYKDRKNTTWFNVVVWGPLAEECGRILHKGSQCLIDGKMQTNEFTGKDGVKRSSMELLANSVDFLDETNHSSLVKHDNKQASYSYGPPPIEDGDVPF